MIVIIGAGIAGLSLGWELVKAGCPVTIFEANTVASGASGVATSYLEPRLGLTLMRRLEWQSLKQWPAWAAELEEYCEMPFGFVQDGQIRVAMESTQKAFENDLAQRREQAWAFEALTSQEVLRREPSLSPKIIAGAFLPEVCRVDGAKLCEALAAAFQKKGGKLFVHEKVEAICPQGGGVSLSTVSGRKIFADTLVLANGLGTNELSGLPADIPHSQPVRGVNVIVDMSALKFPISHLIKHHRNTLCPRSQNRLIVGTTHEPDEFSLNVSQKVVDTILSTAAEIFPDVGDLPIVNITSGLRSKIADGFLRLGRSTQTPAIAYSLSHAGGGFLRAPLIAKEFSDFLLSGNKGHFTGEIIAN